MGLRMWIDNGNRLPPVEDPDLVTNFSSIYDTNTLTSLWKRPHRRWASRHWQTLARKLSVSGVLQKSALFLEPLKKKSKADKMEIFLTSLNFDRDMSHYLSGYFFRGKTKRFSSLALPSSYPLKQWFHTVLLKKGMGKQNFFLPPWLTKGIQLLLV